MRHLILFISLFTLLPSFAQEQGKKEYNKEVALFRAKAFLIKDVLGDDSQVVKFGIDPLASAKSGELTSLAYSCKQKNKRGLILGFFSNRWNPSGVTFNQYSFKNIPEDKAKELIKLIDNSIKEHKKFLNKNPDNYNYYLQYDDLTFLIYKQNGLKIRVFWDDYDATWESTAYDRTKRRLLSIL